MKDIEPTIYSVSEINLLSKGALERNPSLSNVLVKGEIASYKEYPNAIYFDIKDQKSILSCTIWGKDSMRVPFKPKIGDEVVAFGSVTLYASKGKYQFNCVSLSLFGAGEALLALKALKEKLEKEGLFDASKKKKIPSFPKRIGLISGNNSAAMADIIRNVNRRWPYAELVFFPALVQGKNAIEDIKRALALTTDKNLDTLILARGGGSNDDLEAFNDESVVRAFAKINIPKIAAIGHEIDFTLTDFVADLRVSTPTAAAEASTPDQNEIYNFLIETEESLSNLLNHRLKREEERLLSLANRPFFSNPSSLYQKGEEKIENLSSRMNLAISYSLEEKKHQLEKLEGRLSALDPKEVLKRGYSISYDEEGNILRSVKDIAIGKKLKTILKDGVIVSKVEEKENGRED